MVPTKFVLKYIFVKLQDLEKETEFRCFIGLPTDMLRLLFDVAINDIYPYMQGIQETTEV